MAENVPFPGASSGKACHFPKSKCSEYMLIIGRGNDPYTLPSLTAEYGLKVMEKRGKIREHRRYPEVFEYLGWCSWDAFHMDVTHEDLLKKLLNI